jgi:hypothetical protein
MPAHGLKAPDPAEPVPSFTTIYCEDADALYARATHVEDLSEDEMQKRISM